MLPPRSVRPRRRGRPNTTQLLADYLEAHGRRGYEEFRRAMARPGTIEILRRRPRDYQSPAEVFDWLNAGGVLIVVLILAGALFFCFRLCGLL